MFTYDDGLLAEKIWEELVKSKKDNILLVCQLAVAESAVVEMQEQIKSFMNASKASESETDDVKGD